MDEKQELAKRVTDELMQGLVARYVNDYEVVEAVLRALETTPMAAAS